MNVPAHLPSGATDKEIINHVEHNYPNLGPVLRQMVERFKEERDPNQFADESTPGPFEKFLDALAQEITISCPHCGSKAKVELEGYSEEE